jgi:hypothetical protein
VRGGVVEILAFGIGILPDPYKCHIKALEILRNFFASNIHKLSPSPYHFSAETLSTASVYGV